MIKMGAMRHVFKRHTQLRLTGHFISRELIQLDAEGLHSPLL